MTAGHLSPLNHPIRVSLALLSTQPLKLWPKLCLKLMTSHICPPVQTPSQCACSLPNLVLAVRVAAKQPMEA